MFDPNVFGKTCFNRFFTPDKNLMASSTSTQLPNLVFWKVDKKEMSFNPFLMFWGNTKAYIFLPFSLITIVAYRRLLKFLVAAPLLLPKSRSFLSIPETKKIHSMWQELQLIACYLSRKLKSLQLFKKC